LAWWRSLSSTDSPNQPNLHSSIEKRRKKDQSNFIVKSIIRAREMEKGLGSIAKPKQEPKLGVEKSKRKMGERAREIEQERWRTVYLRLAGPAGQLSIGLVQVSSRSSRSVWSADSSMFWEGK
jgi:hypothetical protein